ncbi:MAG: amino acid permease [Leptolyngbyaceae cyanobacterium CRU_2_3]|nr:amino acid permease [Leptolyngbyaceae cyanobacterium CRU_2_3]
MERLKGQANGIASSETGQDSYFSRRQLRGNANGGLLWAFGVGSVIAGNFYGWNYGLVEGGFWGLTMATLLMAVMYLCMAYSLAELSAALPYAGSLYLYTRNAFGSYWGFICGILVTIEYILATAALVFGLANYLKLVVPGIPTSLAWLLFYVVFAAIIIQSLELTMYASLWLTVLAIVILVLFYGSALVTQAFRPELLFNIPADTGQSANWLPKGWQGVFSAVPYGIWFYLAIEILPLTSEETKDVPKSMPTGLITAMFTLIALSLLTLALNTGIGGGAIVIAQSSVPLADGLEVYLGKEFVSFLTIPIAIILGFAASLPTQIYGYSRILFSLSRAGYIPRWISVTNHNAVPNRAVILGTGIGMLCIQILDIGSEVVDAVILNMTVFGAVLSYILVMFSYIKLKISRPDLPRPYKSPLGNVGAMIAALLAIFALVACLFKPAYQAGIWGILIVLAIATLYYFFFSRHHLVTQSSDDKFYTL